MDQKSIAVFIGGLVIGGLASYYCVNRSHRHPVSGGGGTVTPPDKVGPIHLDEPVTMITSDKKPDLVEGCPFCMIIQGKEKVFKIVDADLVVAILAPNPLSRGHCLVISKSHGEKLDELSSIDLTQIGPYLGKVAKAVIEITGTKEYNILQNNGPNAHQDIPHVHFHIIPKNSYDDGLVVNWSLREYDDDESSIQLANELKAKITSTDSEINTTRAICVLEGEVSGTIRFVQNGAAEAVTITGTVKGLKPGKHGFHIHTQSISNTTDDHFNPFKKNHGGPNDLDRHLGDLGNIETDEQGRTEIYLKDKLITLFGHNSIIGRIVGIHAKEDDLGKGDNPSSKMDGDAGKTVGWGVITSE